MLKQIVQRLFSGALLVVSIIFCALLINIGARAVFGSEDFQLTHRNGIRVVEYVLKERIFGEDSSIIAHPYLLYANRPGFSGRGFLQINADGYRIVPQPQRSSLERPQRVLILGGSTTFSYPHVPDPANAWPAQLQKILGPGYEVINAGLSSATSAELLAGYIFRHRYVRPDIVIIHEGGNDVMAMLFDHYNAEYTHLRSPGTRPVAGPFDRAMLRWAGWPARMRYAHNWNTLTTVFSSAPSSIAEISPTDALDRATHAPTEGFERNLDLLVRTIIEDGAIPVLFGFVEAQEALLSRNRPDLQGREHAWKIGLERNLAVMKHIAATRHLAYIDPDDFKVEDNWFLDNCHLNETGEAAKAAFMARSYFAHRP